MTDIRKIHDREGTLLAYWIPADFPEGLSAYSDESDFIQVLTWRYPAEKLLQAHSHNDVDRSALRTQEAVIVMSGKLRANIFDDHRRPISTLEVGEGECMVFLAGGHGYEILADDTRIYEIKNGPFLGVEKDKVKF